MIKKLYRKLSILGRIPEKYRAEYLDRYQETTRHRIRVFYLGVLIMYYFVQLLIFVLNPANFVSKRYLMLLAMTLVIMGCLWLNRQAQSYRIMKAYVHIFIVFLLSMLIYGTCVDPQTFSYTIFILTLLFTTLAVPWFPSDMTVIIGVHYVGWTVYYLTRDFTGMTIPRTFLGGDPFLNGVFHLAFAAAMCLVVRKKEHDQDVDNFLLWKDVELRKDQMERELEFASRVHRTLIPKSHSTEKADIAVSYLPVGTIGGDYARFYFPERNFLLFFISDVTGHGIPAALMVNRLHAEFNTLITRIKDPGELLRELNQFIIRDFAGTFMYSSAVCGLVDFSQNKIFYSNYGHPPQYVYYVRKSEIVGLPSQTTLLGIESDEVEKIYEGEIPYEKDDLILLFTDGVIEIRNQAGEEYGTERFQTFLKSHASLAPEDFNRLLIDEISSFSHHHFRDDIFLLSIKIKE